MKFKIGDKVKVKSAWFGMGNKMGIIIKVSDVPFFHYNVKFKGDLQIYEYHKGELKKFK